VRVGWIEDVKSSVTVAQVAGWLGMSSRLRSFGPCPACNAETRSRSDKRGPVGVNSHSTGWECHACSAKGDPVELACFGAMGSSSSELDSNGWEKLREWFTTHGADTSASANPRKAQRAPTRSVGSMVTGILADGPEARKKARDERAARKPQAAQKTTTGRSGERYSWDEDLVQRCQSAFWEDTNPEAFKVREYLSDVRKISEEACREYRLGLYVGKNGRAVMDNGRPILVIPLIDDTERPVSAKFRSVPVIGTCEHCDTVKGCHKCRTYRNCKDRPLPLYGAHRLLDDLEIPVVLVEGELDVLAAFTYGMTTNVVSTTAGAGTFADDWLDLLEPYSSFIGLYDADEKGDEGFVEVASKLGAYRCARAIPPGGKDIGDCLIAGIEAERIHRAVQRAKPMHGIEMKKAYDYVDPIEILIKNPNLLRGVSTGWAELDRILGGVRPGVIVVSGETGKGKAQPNTEPVLTPSGWRPMGSICVGDMVIAGDGTATEVIGVYPQGVRPVMRVTFTDGVEVLCDEDHLWDVASDLDVWRGKPWRTMNTRDVAASVMGSKRFRWRVPLISTSVEHSEATLPIDPYILGVLLGDGSLTNSGARFTNGDKPILDEVSRRLPDDLVLTTTPTISKALDCRIKSVRRGDENKISSALTSMGVRKLSVEKRIPGFYLTASTPQRMDLLRGLMDTDGWAQAGRPAFGTSSPGLAQDVANLVRSLGGAVSISSKGRGRHHDAWMVTVNVDADVFLLPRKRDAIKGRVRSKYPPRKISSVKAAGEAECTCIQVAHKDQRYVTTGYTVTHNTTLITALLLNLARRQLGCMLTSFEQEPIGTVQKLLRNEVGGDFTQVEEETRRAALENLGRLPLWILDHYGHITPAKLVETMRYAQRRHGVRYFLVDHLGFMIDPDAPDERRAIEAVIRALAIVAKQMGISIFLVAHPHNTKTDHKGKAVPVTGRDLKGASAIRQDADDILIVSQLKPTTKVPWPRAKIVADKVRSDFAVSGGECELVFDPGSTSYGDTLEDTPMGRDGLIVPKSSKR